MRPQDKVALVVYAGNAGVVLPATSGNDKQKIKEAIDNLEAGGSTAGGEGIRLAYKIAGDNFAVKGNNRVILCTDGDFNVGISSDDGLETMIEKERESGIFLTVLGSAWAITRMLKCKNSLTKETGIMLTLMA